MPRSALASRLLAPYPLERFLERDWGRHPLVVRGTARKFARIFSWQALNTLLETHRLEPPRLRLAYSGRASLDLRSFVEYLPHRGGTRPVLDVRRLNSLLAHGATLVMNELQDMHPPIAQVTRAFALLFAGEPNVNLYASFGREPGFGPHWDDHDVLVLQIAGEKRWLLYGENRRHPLARDVQPNEMQPTRVLARHQLRAGDLLYIPRGHWHDAIANGEPTLHLTLGLKTLTAVDFLKWIGDELLGAESLRRDLPLFDAKARKRWSAQFRSAIERRTTPEALDEFLADQRDRFRPVARPALPHSIRDEPSLDPDTRLQWTGIAFSARRRPGRLAIRSGGEEYHFDAAAAPLIESLLNGRAMTLQAIERRHARALGPQRLRRFVRELLREHFLTIVP